MFAIYLNRLGCLGSIAISLIGTIVLCLILWALSR